MAEVKMHFKGWMIVPAIVLLVSFVAWRHHSLQGALTGEVAEVIRVRIASEITRGKLPGAQAAVEQGNTAYAEGIADRLVSAEDVELVNPRTKGIGDNVLVRFEIQIHSEGTSIPSQVRYYELERVFGSWQVKRERTRWSWYLRLL